MVAAGTIAGVGVNDIGVGPMPGPGGAPGAIVGGLLIGLIEQYAGVYLPDGSKDIAAYLVLIAVLVVKPTGLLGEAHGRRV